MKMLRKKPLKGETLSSYKNTEDTICLKSKNNIQDLEH